MVHQSFHRQRTSSARIPGAALLGVWLAGSSLGLWAARFYGDAYGPLVLQAGETSLSFVSACVVTLLPLLLSAFAVFFFHRPGVFGACLLRGISLGFFLGVFSAVGGLWLAVLLLFSGLAYSPVLLWYLWRRLELGLGGAGMDCLWCGLAGILLAAADTWLVAPFLATALSF
jgi:hypothetical protein